MDRDVNQEARKTMTVTIPLSPEEEKRLLAHAAASGQDVTSYVLQIVKEKIEKPLTFDQIFAPLREEVQESGITDDELDTLFRQAREEVWHEKQAKQNKPS